MNKNRTLVIVAAALGLTVALTSCSPGWGGVAQTPPSATEETSTPSASPSDNEDEAPDEGEESVVTDPLGPDWEYEPGVYDLFDAYGVELEMVNGQLIPVLKAGSLLAGKLYCDAVMPPMQYGTVQESIVNILVYPDYAAHVAHTLSQIPEYVTANPQLAEFKNVSYISIWANRAINGNDATRLEAAKLMYWIARAADKMGDLGTGTATTSYNTHLRTPDASDAYSCLKVSDYVLPFEVNTQYSGSFRFMGILIKGSSECRKWVVGINLEDGRWVIIEIDCTPPTTNCAPNCGDTTDRCEPNEWWDGDECLEVKNESLSVPFEGDDQMDSGPLTPSDQGTGTGTSGNIIQNGGSPGSVLGGTAGGASDGNGTINGGDSDDATDVDADQSGGTSLGNLE